MKKPAVDEETIALPKLVTADVLARHLNLAKSGIYEKARKGELPHIRIGKSMRFDPARVAEFLRERSV